MKENTILSELFTKQVAMYNSKGTVEPKVERK